MLEDEDVHAQRMWGWLSKGYRAEQLGWEQRVRFLVKLSIVLASIVCEPWGAALQGLVILAVLMLALFAQLWCQPLERLGAFEDNR